MGWTPTLVVVLGVSTILCCNFGQIAANPHPQIGSIVEHKSALLGEKACLQGPSYWCQNFTTARQCNANKHCIQTVWEHQAPAPDNGPICDICTKMVNKVRNELKYNITQGYLQLVLDYSCMFLIPRMFEPLQYLCVELADEAIPQLTEVLESLMNPHMVCAVFGLCKNARTNALLATLKVAEAVEIPKLEGDMPCELCEQIIVHLNDILVANITENEFEQVLIGICAQTPIFKEKCVDLVETYSMFIYFFLKTELHGTMICTQIGICPRSFSSVPPLYPLLPVEVGQTLQKDPASGLHRVPLVSTRVSVHTQTDPLPLDSLIIMPGDKNLCQMCEYLLLVLQRAITDPKTEQNIIETGEKACKELKDQYAPTCRSFFDSYTTAVIALLAHDIDPSEVCPKIGVCPGLTLSAVECQQCQATTTQLLNKVGSNTSEAHVVKQVRQLCLSLPFEESRICSRMLGSHSGDLADMALAEFTGEEMCYYMQYCRAESSQAAVGNGNTENLSLPR